jgi:hypothetical protein
MAFKVENLANRGLKLTFCLKRHYGYFQTLKLFLSLIADCNIGLPAPCRETSLGSLLSPLQGTDSSRQFSHANEYRAMALPFPMNTWAPYTQPQNESLYYIY